MVRVVVLEVISSGTGNFSSKSTDIASHVLEVVVIKWPSYAVQAGVFEPLQTEVSQHLRIDSGLNLKLISC